MVLVDTSVWIYHLRRSHTHLQDLLSKGEVICHPFVIGELACGNLRRREEILSLLEALPSAPLVQHHEILNFIEGRQLMGLGIGLIDVHLLASALMGRDALWTSDKKLHAAAARLDLLYR